MILEARVWVLAEEGFGGLTIEVDFVRETVMEHVEQYVAERLIA